jgi:hypothetical protein
VRAQDPGGSQGGPSEFFQGKENCKKTLFFKESTLKLIGFCCIFLKMALETLCHRASETRLNESGTGIVKGIGIGARNARRRCRARVGQAVYVRSLGVARVPYIAVIRRIRNGVATMQWYFRPEDLPAGTRVPYEPAPTELFLSDTCDDNTVDLVLGPCDVHAKETSTGYFCRALFARGEIGALTESTGAYPRASARKGQEARVRRSRNS